MDLSLTIVIVVTQARFPPLTAAFPLVKDCLQILWATSSFDTLQPQKNMAATSMAAALAASLPAPSSVAAAPVPTYEAIPASMAKVIDIEAEIPLTCVQLDGLVRPFSK